MDLDRDEFLRPLAILDDELRQLLSRSPECRSELLERRIIDRLDTFGGWTGGPCSGEQNRIRGRSVSIDGDAVEGLGNHPLQQAIEKSRAYLRIGKEEGEHRRHVGRDHSG